MVFVSSLSGRFGLVARFPYALKENIKNKNFVVLVHALKTNIKSVKWFFALWLPGKSDVVVKYSNGGR